MLEAKLIERGTQMEKEKHLSISQPEYEDELQKLYQLTKVQEQIGAVPPPPPVLGTGMIEGASPFAPTNQRQETVVRSLTIYVPMARWYSGNTSLLQGEAEGSIPSWATATMGFTLPVEG